MAKFRFPGKALKLNARKRVRFRGSPAANTPEELYTRRIRKGLELFTQIFGDSEEDEDGFEGFLSSQPETRVVRAPARAAPPAPPSTRAAKRVAQKAEQACVGLEEEGLATLRRTGVVEGPVSEVREGEGARRTESDGAREGAALPQDTPVQEPPGGQGEECAQETNSRLGAAAANLVTRKQTNHRISRQPTVKTALAKKLLAKAKKKVPSLPAVGEKSPKRFILPTMSARSSRIIKPNKRLFADITEMCSAGAAVEGGEEGEGSGAISVSPKRLVKLPRKGRGSHTQFLPLPRSRAHAKDAPAGVDGLGRDRMRRTISLYTESMTGPCKGQVGRPPKRLLRRLEAPQQEVEAEVPDSPQRCDPKESRVKAKIEKLLRSPWDNRLKQTAKGGKGDGEELMPAPACTTSPTLSASGTILRKARLNLNKTTLQKIRNPASLQRFIPLCDGGSVEGKCAICDIAGENFLKFGILFCEVCSSFLGKATAGPKEVMECLGSKGECRVQGVEGEERCPACWLFRVLTSCAVTNILHDHLRKRLPPHLKERLPTSLARCMSGTSSVPPLEKDAELAGHMKRLPLDPGGGGAFGSVMDLPGGWRRKIGPEVIVVSPNGDKFRSVQKLEEFLKKQGISADARVLFGNSSGPAVDRSSEVKSKPSTPSTSGGSRARVVMTTLPGGWTRRIKWRSAGDRFDTYVYSPDGRTFRSRRELSAYFNLIGKVDDIHKYFPVVTGHSDTSIPSSSDTPGSSSTEPVSSSEPCSEISSDDKSPEASECEADLPKHKFQKPLHFVKGKKSKSLEVKPVKGRSHKQQKGLSKGRSNLAVVEEGVGLGVEQQDRPLKAEEPAEIRATESKQKKQKVSVRSRQLAAVPSFSKEDTSHTDTTESESEQTKPHSITIFHKSFSRSRNGKSKLVASPPLFGTDSSSVCSPPPAKDTKSQGSPQRSPRDTGDTALSSTDTTDFKLSGKKQKKTMDQAITSPEPSFAAPLDSANKDASPAGEPAKGSSGKRQKKVTEQALPTPEATSPTGDKKPTKIVLKIPKKAITIKPVRKRMKSRKKTVEDGSSSTLKEEKPASKQPSVGETSWEVEPEAPAVTATTKKLSDVTQGKSSSHEAGKVLMDVESDGLADYDTTDKSKAATSPSVSEGEAFRVPVVKKSKFQKPVFKYQTYRFGQGWTRKIRWNDKGEGRVALLHSPDGQSIRSRIELMAYFKKSGKSQVDLDYYFPLGLIKSHSSLPAAPVPTPTLATSTSAQSSETSEFSDSDAFVKTSEDSWGSGEETRRSRISRPVKHYRRMLEGKGLLEDISEEAPVSTYQNSTGKSSGAPQEDSRKLIPLPSKGGKNIIVSIHEVKPAGAKSETEEGEEVVGEAGGPRVKHVCRSQAQVLRITRAVFPSPKKEEQVNGGPNPKVKGKQKRKIVTVTTTPSGKVLRKTQWCSKCPGCTTPNCLKCSNCLDMKKYGGPGTKKKPCIMRKCQNPRLATKCAGSQEPSSKAPPTSASAATATTPTPGTAPTAPVLKEARKVSLPTLKLQEKLEGLDPESDSTSKSLQQEKGGVFIPRQMMRTQPDQKDRGDIAAGKQFVPGALVNIDYWQGYDADEMMLTGYPVTTASPLHPQVLCFRCGSLGKEQLLYCAWCCEGIHPYCLEDGEGPESETEEVFWICRRCAVCHVCGAPGADSLLRCSDCRNYYHLECLGPSAHSTCQPTPDRPWEADLWALLGGSWPRQSAIYGVSVEDLEGSGTCGPPGAEHIQVHTELDALKEDGTNDEDEMPDIYFLPSTGDALTANEDFEALEDTICLEDSIVEVFRDVDLHQPPPSPTAHPLGGGQVASMKEDEYLYLGYKKVSEYPSRRLELSYYRLLQIIHNEHFDTLGYPTWRELLQLGLVQERPTCLGSASDHGSDTDTASEGRSEAEESCLDWEEIFETRRFEAAEEMRERDNRKREVERKKREVERERARLERLKELEREAKEKEREAEAQLLASSTASTPKAGSEEIPGQESAPRRGRPPGKRKRRGRPPGSLNKPKHSGEDFVVLDDPLDLEGSACSPRKRCRQPTSWEEFDQLFARLSSPPCATGSRASQEPKAKQRVIYSDGGKVRKVRPANYKMKLEKDRYKFGAARSKKLKAMLQDARGRKLPCVRNKLLLLKGKKNSLKGGVKGRPREDPQDGKKLAKRKLGSTAERKKQGSASSEHSDRPDPGEGAGKGDLATAAVTTSLEDHPPTAGLSRSQGHLGPQAHGEEEQGKAEVKLKPEEENSDKENLPHTMLAKILENGILSPQRKSLSREEAGSSSRPEGEAQDCEDARADEGCKQALDTGRAETVELPGKRTRRTIGRASELASQRKAMMDY